MKNGAAWGGHLFCKQNIRGVRNPYSSLHYTWKVNQEGSWACLLNKGRLLAWASIALLSVKTIKKECYL